MAVTPPSDPVAARFAALRAAADRLESEGLPFPTDSVREEVEQALAEGHPERAEPALARAEALLEKVRRDWQWLRELLGRVNELRELAARSGMDMAILDARVGDPRAQLRGIRVSEGAIDQAAASASLALAQLNDLLPKYFVQEARKLGESIRTARARGYEIESATQQFAEFLKAIKDGQIRGTAQAFLELRHTVAKAVREPPVGVVPSEEEEEILLEARNLARRLNRMKSRARNAQSAARLMAQVRAALSEDRRTASPEEEIEELWGEVDRLTRERQEAKPEELPELDPSTIPPELLEAANAPAPEEPRRAPRNSRRSQA